MRPAPTAHSVVCSPDRASVTITRLHLLAPLCSWSIIKSRIYFAALIPRSAAIDLISFHSCGVQVNDWRISFLDFGSFFILNSYRG